MRDWLTKRFQEIKLHCHSSHCFPVRRAKCNYVMSIGVKMIKTKYIVYFFFFLFLSKSFPQVIENSDNSSKWMNVFYNEAFSGNNQHKGFYFAIVLAGSETNSHRFGFYMGVHKENKSPYRSPNSIGYPYIQGSDEILNLSINYDLLKQINIIPFIDTYWGIGPRLTYSFSAKNINTDYETASERYTKNTRSLTFGINTCVGSKYSLLKNISINFEVSSFVGFTYERWEEFVTNPRKSDIIISQKEGAYAPKYIDGIFEYRVGLSFLL